MNSLDNDLIWNIQYRKRLISCLQRIKISEKQLLYAPPNEFRQLVLKYIFLHTVKLCHNYTNPSCLVFRCYGIQIVMSYILLEIQVVILNEQKGPTKGEGEAIMTMYINQQKPQMVFSIMQHLPHITNDMNYSFRSRIYFRNVVGLKKM